MVKFGEKLAREQRKQWDGYYLDYVKLKDIIKELEAQSKEEVDIEDRRTSITVPRATDAAGLPVTENGASHEAFFTVLEQEMAKIDHFTATQIAEIRAALVSIDRRVEPLDPQSTSIMTAKLSPEKAEELRESLHNEVNRVAEEFLQLEKYVNLNFTAFHKILKKHDKRLPNPCKAFYIGRLHEQSWVKGDYSDVLVSMSKVYGALRGDHVGEKVDEDRQDFCRTTTKYWVHTEDISRVKYIVLQHLPVFLQSEMGGNTDSQLVNSVYLDNTAMELYRGRLDKTPGAIALRMRWYSTPVPNQAVFVERKTHREAWAGEVSVKERFIVKEDQVLSILNGSYSLDAEMQRMREKGKSEEAVKNWYELSSEILQAINTKQLVPTLRTQYMRTAFQIPFDATVRVSLDTNLCMINEITKETAAGTRWYRDPSKPIPTSEITRFPHAVLEVKLQLVEGEAPPSWVTSLIESGMLMQVHKFSKFIHGCAVLMPEDVTSVPYWIDDPTLAASIQQSGASSLLRETGEGLGGTNADLYSHMLPHHADGSNKNRRVEERENFQLRHTRRIQYEGGESAVSSAGTSLAGGLLLPSSVGGSSSGGSGGQPGRMFEQPYQFDPPGRDDSTCYDQLCGGTQWTTCCEFAGPVEFDKSMVPQKIEPKLILANERTFIKWLHMSVVLSALSTGVLAFSSTTGDAQYFAIAMLPVSLLMIIYAVWTYYWRCEIIKTRAGFRWDDPLGPVLLTVVLTLVLVVQFGFKLTEFLMKPR